MSLRYFVALNDKTPGRAHDNAPNSRISLLQIFPKPAVMRGGQIYIQQKALASARVARSLITKTVGKPISHSFVTVAYCAI